MASVSVSDLFSLKKLYSFSLLHALPYSENYFQTRVCFTSNPFDENGSQLTSPDFVSQSLYRIYRSHITSLLASARHEKLS